MGQIINVNINRFDGSLSEDKRLGWEGGNGFFTTKYFGLTKHFDAFTYPKKLVPYWKTEADEDKTYDITQILYVPWESSYRLLGYGGVVGDILKGRIYLHDADLTATGWAVGDEGGTATTNRNKSIFFYYKDYVYWWAGGAAAGQLMRVHITAGDHGLTAYQAINYTNVAQPVHHPADDIAYFFNDNKVSKLNDTSWTLNALTLPSQFKIVSACPYGNYLAIGCVTVGQTLDVKSTVFLWDRDSSLTTLSERIDFGEGTLQHLVSLNNKLIGLLNFYIDNSLSLNRGKILIKQASGNFAVKLNELNVDDTSGVVMGVNSVRRDNKLYFTAIAPLKGDSRNGIWVVDEFGKITLDFIEEDLGVSSPTFQGIYLLANQWWITHSADGSVQRSDNDLAYSTTLASVYESLIFNAGDSDLTKKLIGVAVMTEKMPTAGQIVLKYRIDGATSWTTIYTDTTDSQISHGAINIETGGANLPTFKEIEFQINSTGGAVVTGLKFKCEIIDKQLF